MLAIADRSQDLFADIDVGLFSKSADLALHSFFRPALVTVFQYMEDLPDRRASEATRTRVEWKYALRLPLNHPGLDHSTLCEFRRRLRLDVTSRQAFQKMLTRLQASSFAPIKSSIPWAAEHILATVCNLSRVELTMHRMYQVLDVLATHQPEWLCQFSLLSKYGRYSRKLTRPLSGSPQAQAELVRELGADACFLIEVLEDVPAQEPAFRAELQALRQVWSQNFVQQAGQMTWRVQCCVACHPE